MWFERFLNPERVSPPDFDIDFCPVRREKTIEYVIEKYGEPNVSQIITFGTMAAKAAIKDVARVLKMPYSEVDKITKLFPSKMPKAPAIEKVFGISKKPEDAEYAVAELHTMYESDPLIQKIVDTAVKLENMPRNTSIHAAGVVICCDDISDHVPMAKNGEMVTTQFDKNETEHLGLLKMDFLGLITLTDLDLMIKLIKQRTGETVDFYNGKFRYDDPEVYKLIGSGDNDGVFQLESGGISGFAKEMKPVNIEEIIVILAMYRPGPMDEIPTYIKNRKNPESIIYPDPKMKDVLGVTYGVMVYQEQVMKLCQVLAGYTMGQADGVRKIMGKKLADKLPIEKQRFIYGWEDPEGKKSIEGVLKRGMKLEDAEKLWSQMEKFGSYAFNKAHAAAYAFITYQTAWMKLYHKIEFYTAIMNNRITKSDELTHYMELARQHDINILPPNVNKSLAYFSIESDKDIRYGLGGIKNVGVALVEDLVREREANGEFKSLQDFISRMGGQAHNKRFLESMIYSGAFDCFVTVSGSSMPCGSYISPSNSRISSSVYKEYPRIGKRSGILKTGMFRKLVREDIRNNKFSTGAIVLFSGISVMLFTLTIILFANLLGAIDRLMEKARTPDYLQMHAGVVVEKEIQEFAQANPQVKECQISRFLNLENDKIYLGEHCKPSKSFTQLSPLL